MNTRTPPEGCKRLVRWATASPAIAGSPRDERAICNASRSSATGLPCRAGCDLEWDLHVGRPSRALVCAGLEAAVDAVPAGVLEGAVGEQPVGASAPGTGRREAPGGLAV